MKRGIRPARVGSGTGGCAGCGDVSAYHRREENVPFIAIYNRSIERGNAQKNVVVAGHIAQSLLKSPLLPSFLRAKDAKKLREFLKHCAKHTV
jgi:hypothetical protein